MLRGFCHVFYRQRIVLARLVIGRRLDHRRIEAMLFFFVVVAKLKFAPPTGHGSSFCSVGPCKPQSYYIYNAIYLTM